MAETVYTTGVAGEMPEIIDFINYVFSQAHVPHDFKTLLPKVYGDGAPAGGERFHFLAKQNGKIVGCVACRPTELIFGGQTLSCGFVGSVSVHPYHRGEGHMKRLMADLLESAKAQNYDMLILGGQRQRYNYFGFEQAGIRLNYNINKRNVRHVLGGLDISDIHLRPMIEGDVPACFALWSVRSARAARSEKGFLAELRSWHRTPEVIEKGGAFAGYVADHELAVADAALLPFAVKALLSRDADSLRFTADRDEKDKIKAYAAVCENSSLGSEEMINVLNWPRVLKVLLEYKHAHISPVSDGSCALSIEGDGAFSLDVRDGRAAVKRLESAPPNAVSFSHLQAQRVFFGLSEMILGQEGIDPSWQGLPFMMSEQDAF